MFYPEWDGCAKGAENDGDELGMCTGWRDEGTNRSILLTNTSRSKLKKNKRQSRKDSFIWLRKMFDSIQSVLEYFGTLCFY
jgi:hypothetical protein